VNLSVQGSTTTTFSNWALFINAPFIPTTAPTVQVGKFVQNATDLQFVTQIDFTSLSNTSSLVLGLGNFGYGAGIPSYQLKAFDPLGMPMSLTGFTQIGSYANEFAGIDSGHLYNDNVFLNQSTGIFEVTTVPGGDDNNSDILLIKLVAGVGHLEISPVGGNWVAGVGGDSIHVLVATATMAKQTITFGAAPTVSVGGTGTVSATGGASNNPVTFTSTTAGVCTISGSMVTGLAVGTCTIAANQAGNDNYNAASQSTQSFSVSGFALTVSIAKSIGGTVASNLGGFACGRTCSASFASGTLVTLTAIPVSGYEFTGWGGACRGYGNSCTVTMNAVQTVTANFAVFTIHQPVWKRVIKSIIKGGG